MAYTITFDANGSTFENGSTTNTINYSSDYKLVTKYSHTDNISDDGTQNSNYGNNEKKTEVVTIDGATSLTVTVTYGGESDTYDWVSIFSGSHPTYTAASNYSSADIVQKLGGGSHTSQTKTYTVSGDSVTFAWKSDSSGYGDGYGYYAVVSATIGTVTGTYAKPTAPDGKKFIGWSTDNSATEATYAKDGSDIPTDQNLMLYAVYIDFQWCDVWDYKLDSTEKTIWIYKYNGDETDYTVPASATIDGVTYTTKIGYNTWNGSYYGIIGGIYQTWYFSLDTGAITNISFQKGVVTSTSLENLFVSKSSKLTSIDLSNLDTSKVTSMSSMFSGCSDLTSLDLSNFNTNNVKEMDRMFAGCESLVSLNLSIFSTSQVSNMAFMFCNCHKLTNLNISNFNTSKVAYMSYMFDNCSNLIELDLSNFDTNKVTTMYAMFYGCGRLRNLNISSFNTSSVTSMSMMFYACNSLTSLDLSNFDTSEVTNMGNMFSQCFKLTSLDLSNFVTSKVTNMYEMFYACNSLTSLDLSNFDTSEVTNMGNMFSQCFKLTSLDLSNFVTSKVTNMYEMFYACNSLTSLDLSNFDTSEVTNMGNMFYKSSSTSSIINISNWDISKVTSYSGFLTNWNFNTLSSNLTADGWSENNLKKVGIYKLNANGGVFKDGSAYKSEILYTTSVDTTYLSVPTGKSLVGWSTTAEGETVVDTPTSCGTWYAIYDTYSWIYDWKYKLDTDAKTAWIYYYKGTDTTYTIPATATIRGVNYSTKIGYNTWNGTTSGTLGNYSRSDWTYPLKTNTITNLLLEDGIVWDDNCSMIFNNNTSLRRIDGFLGADNVTNMSFILNNCTNLYYFFGSLISNNVTDMSGMFNACTDLWVMQDFDTSEATDMSYMCCYLSSSRSSFNFWENVISKWDTSKVTSMYSMFYGCSAPTTLNLSNFDTSQVTDMTYMFNNCSRLTSLNLSSFNTSKVEVMYKMFQGCSKLSSLNISGFDTKQVTDMGAMFSNCHKLTSLDVSNFDTGQVIDMYGMFHNCNNLTSLNLSNFVTSSVTDMHSMFDECNRLTNLDLSSFDTGQVTDMSDMFYYCSSLTSLDLSSFDVSNVTNSWDIFNYCNSLTDLNINGWDLSNATSHNTIHINDKTLLTIHAEGCSDSTLQKLGIYRLEANGGSYNTTEQTRTYRLEYSSKNARPTPPAGLSLCGWSSTADGEIESVLNYGTNYALYDEYSWIYDWTYEIVTDDTADYPVGIWLMDYLGEEKNYAIQGKATIRSTEYPIWVDSWLNTGVIENLSFDSSLGNIKAINFEGLFSNCFAYEDEEEGLVNLKAVNLDGLEAVTTESSPLEANEYRYIHMFAGCTNLTTISGTITNAFTPQDMTSMFAGCEKLTKIDFTSMGIPTDTSHTTNIDYMFSDCKALIEIQGIQYWDTSALTSAECAFIHCESLKSLDLNSWDVTSLSNVMSMFSYCTSLESLSVSDWDVSAIENFYGLFSECNSLKEIDVSSWDMGSATSLAYMFEGCSSLPSLNVKKWNTENVTTLASTFAGCETLTALNLNSWDVSKVEDMQYLFDDCKNLTTLNISDWDTSSVTSMYVMFGNCESLKSLPIGYWNVSNVNFFDYMFYACYKLSYLPIQYWDTYNAYYMEGMFYGCSSLTDLNLTYWQVSNVSYFYDMFAYCESLKTLNLSTWDMYNVWYMSYMFYGCTSLEKLWLWQNLSDTYDGDDEWLNVWGWYNGGTALYDTENPILEDETNNNYIYSLVSSKLHAIKMRKGEHLPDDLYIFANNLANSGYTGNWTAFNALDTTHGSNLKHDISYDGKTYVSLAASYNSITDLEWEANPDGIWFVWEYKGTTAQLSIPTQDSMEEMTLCFELKVEDWSKMGNQTIIQTPMMEVASFVYNDKFALLPNLRSKVNGLTCNTLVKYTDSDPDRVMCAMVASKSSYRIYLYQDGVMSSGIYNGGTTETTGKPLAFKEYYTTMYDKGYRNNIRAVAGVTFSDFRIYSTALSEEDVKDYFWVQLRSSQEGVIMPYEISDNTDRLSLGRDGVFYSNGEVIEGEDGFSIKQTGDILCKEVVER